MNKASEDIKAMLLAETPLGLTFATNLFIGKEPAILKNCVTIFDTPGQPIKVSLDEIQDDFPSIQIRVRSNSYVTGLNLANDIAVYLQGISNEYWNNTLYYVINCVSGPFQLDWDDNDNARFVVNFNIKRKVLADTTEYTMGISMNTGGTIYPTSGSYSYPKNTIIPIHAIASTGYRFVKWVKNGIQDLTALTYVKLTTSFIVIAQFIAQFQLTTSASGLGTITPASGLKDDGENVTITVTPTTYNPALLHFELIVFRLFG